MDLRLRVEVGPRDQVPWFHIAEAAGEGVLRVTEGTPLTEGVLQWINDLIFGEEFMLGGVTAPAMSEEVAQYINSLINRAMTSLHEG